MELKNKQTNKKERSNSIWNIVCKFSNILLRSWYVYAEQLHVYFIASSIYKITSLVNGQLST